MENDTEYKHRKAPSFYSDQLSKETAQIRFSTDSIAEKNMLSYLETIRLCSDSGYVNKGYN